MLYMIFQYRCEPVLILIGFEAILKMKLFLNFVTWRKYFSIKSTRTENIYCQNCLKKNVYFEKYQHTTILGSGIKAILLSSSATNIHQKHSLIKSVRWYISQGNGQFLCSCVSFIYYIRNRINIMLIKCFNKYFHGLLNILKESLSFGLSNDFQFGFETGLILIIFISIFAESC